jgi:hypothetical protein
MTFNWRLAGLLICEAAGLGALALLVSYLPALNPADMWSPNNLVAYGLLFAGPLLVFLPLSLVLRLGPVWLLGAGSWALLGYVLIFVPAPDRDSADFLTYVALLALIFAALTSLLALPMGLLGKRLLPIAGPAEVMRALRQGGLLALFVVGLLAMSPLGLLNWLNAFLLFTIVALTEFFFLARD